MKMKIAALLLALAAGTTSLAQWRSVSGRVEGYVHMFTNGWGTPSYFLVNDFGSTYGLPDRFYRRMRRYYYSGDRIAVTGDIYSYWCYGLPCPNYAFSGSIFLEAAVDDRSDPIPTPPVRVEGRIERFEVRRASQIVVAYYLADYAGTTYELPADFFERIVEFYESRTRIAVTGNATGINCYAAPCPNFTFRLGSGTVLIEVLVD